MIADNKTFKGSFVVWTRLETMLAFASEGGR